MKATVLTIFILALLISFIGVMSIYSSTYQKEAQQWQSLFQRQILWIIFGAALFLYMSNLNYRHLWDVAYLLYALAILFLLLVFMLGIVRLGAQRWIRLAWFNFQPSEVAKIAVVIFMARYFSTKSVQETALRVSRFSLWRSLFIPFFFMAAPIVLIIEQPDLGSGAMVLAIFLAMLYLSGVKLGYIWASLGAMLAMLPFVWHFLRDYQKDRLMVFLNPNIDPLGAGYTIIQSKIAIGSGGFFGKGWLSGTQGQLRFLPESHTDFIFATFAEEWGFFGCCLLLLLYYLLIRQGIMIALRTADDFGKLLALGISSMLGLQVAVNIAMNMGLAPVVGLPLPLMSYGGSSVCVTFISLGILASIDRNRAVF
ncbi:MAG: rod shape-determining protein RodA [Candidatus Omnitrophota bacterium]